MKLITIMVSDETEASTVYIGDLDPRIAAHCCWKAAEALDVEVPDIEVNRSTTTDWTS